MTSFQILYAYVASLLMIIKLPAPVLQRNTRHVCGRSIRLLLIYSTSPSENSLLPNDFDDVVVLVYIIFKSSSPAEAI